VFSDKDEVLHGCLMIVHPKLRRPGQILSRAEFHDSALPWCFILPYRYEEPGSHRIQSFPRVIDDSVRRPDERRKRQRDAKAARKQAEKEAREVEVRRLKNLKKQEIQDM